MKAILMALVACLAVAAEAKTFTCAGVQDTDGTVTLSCDEGSCQVDIAATNKSALHSDNVVPTNVNLAGCTAKRRKETNAKIYANLRYYDVLEKGCWADYIRVSKQLFASGSGNASFVKAGGGDTHDYSGYQYLSVHCQ
jgi:hypothetical protein